MRKWLSVTLLVLSVAMYGAQTLVDLSHQAKNAPAGSGVTILAGGQTIGTRSAVDIVAGDGILASLTDTGSKIIVQHSVDMATIRALPTGPMPACSQAYRGRIWLTEGGAGVADEVAVCVKTASDTWVWRVI